MALREVIRTTSHRPWPLPDSPWVMTQTWDNLLFAHWPIPAEAMRRAIPASLELDTYDGQAWLGIVPFKIVKFRPRAVTSLPRLSSFLELNVRTYVKLDDKPGVYFFSLEAASLPAVIGARVWFALPYFFAKMSIRHSRDWLHYTSHRTHPGAPPAEWRGSYRPTGPVTLAEPGSLDQFLTERYCLYSVKPGGRIYRGEIHHEQWPLQPAEAEIEVNAMGLPSGIELPDSAPLLHFARRLKVAMWAPHRAR